MLQNMLYVVLFYNSSIPFFLSFKFPSTILLKSSIASPISDIRFISSTLFITSIPLWKILNILIGNIKWIEVSISSPLMQELFLFSRQSLAVWAILSKKSFNIWFTILIRSAEIFLQLLSNSNCNPRNPFDDSLVVFLTLLCASSLLIPHVVTPTYNPQLHLQTTECSS